MSYWWLLLAVFLYFASAFLLVAEVFLPSGGLISLGSAVCLISGIVIFFNYSALAGWIGVVTAIAMIPTVLVGAYKVFPKTRFGKSIITSPPVRDSGDAIPDTNELRDLYGKTGVVLSPLRPVGTCDFSGRRFECVAESGYIAKDQEVKVIRVQGTQLTVRPVNQS